MPSADPASIDLKALFRDAAMFDSRSSWGVAGFEVFNRSNNGKIMVARHPQVAGLLFKKYTSDLSQKDQLQNFERRAEGSRQLRSFVDDQGLRRIVVPRKWILELPRAVSRKETSHVLVVDQIDLIGDEQTKDAYGRIDPDVLAELCAVLFRFRGMDSNGKNLPFTAGGRIALIDTEHWDRGSSKDYLHHVGEYLAPGRRTLAERIFDHLEDGKDVRSAALAGDDFDDEDTSDSSSDSSSSS
jgi:hypothetical protein